MAGPTWGPEEMRRWEQRVPKIMSVPGACLGALLGVAVAEVEKGFTFESALIVVAWTIGTAVAVYLAVRAMLWRFNYYRR